MEATSVLFASAARALGQAARHQGLAVPGFRSPPRLAQVDRSLRRLPSGHVMIAIRLRGRPWIAVVSDMIEGVLVANRLAGLEADARRRALWSALEAEALLPAAPVAEPADPAEPAGPAMAADPPRASPARSPRSDPPPRRRRPVTAPTPQRRAA